jgi:hypothetical protein
MGTSPADVRFVMQNERATLDEDGPFGEVVAGVGFEPTTFRL